MDSKKEQRMAVLLRAWCEGRDEALADILSLAYDDMLIMARQVLTGERYASVIDAEELVHMSYETLRKRQKRTFVEPKDWFGFVKKLMRRSLTDCCRKVDRVEGRTSSLNDLMKGGGW